MRKCVYNLEIDPYNEQSEAIYDEFIYTFEKAKNSIVGGELVIWSTYENDVKEFSKKYPDFVFTLDGAESVPDGTKHTWLKYFKNGKVQNANLSWDEFDENKLK